MDEALRRCWDVTTFNRGRSGRDVPGVRAVRGGRTEEADLNRLAAQGSWDAVIDTSSSGLPPRDVRLAAQALRDAASRWVHVSTASVCSGWPHRTPAESSEVLDCPSDADESFGHSGVQRGHRSCVRTKLVLGGESAEVFQALGGSLATRRSLTAAP